MASEYVKVKVINNVAVYICKICNKKYATSKSATTHVKRKHLTTNKHKPHNQTTNKKQTTNK